ncbi:hypothetical protein ABZX85_30565 [Streptomyces sp. NPDC004539]|uniref:hypothetical protein n=1 Tax=Streptomyces sp. NPDC004539 TaxID=3154280 RepID=UPI0033B74EAD
MIEHVLRLYPAAYRQAHGGEIAATYREMTAGEPLHARLREAAALAAHAIRTRTGLGSATPAARLLALAHPFALAASAAACGLYLLRCYIALTISPAPLGMQLREELSGAWGVLLVSSFTVLAGAASALAGRWRFGVPCTVAGLLAFAAGAVLSGPAYGDPVVTPGAAVLTAAVVLACPPDRRTESLAAGRAGVAGAVVALVVVPRAAVEAHAVPGVSTDYGCWPLVVLGVTGVVLARRGGPGSGRAPAAVVLASPLLLAQAYTTGWGAAAAVLLLLALLGPKLTT